LKLRYDGPLSNFAFKIKLRRYILAVNAARVRPGDTVLDPCAGGGAMLLAALHLAGNGNLWQNDPSSLFPTHIDSEL
jgi:ubiquinone/menaquinone biosynthesis C-methylase UbiE